MEDGVMPHLLPDPLTQNKPNQRPRGSASLLEEPPFAQKGSGAKSSRQPPADVAEPIVGRPIS